MTDTIFALSSGTVPAAIAVIRISGPQAGQALLSLGGTLPKPRRATFRELRDASGELLDQALVLWLPGPHTATGEDIAELHLHGGRAVVGAVEAELGTIEKLRRATPGEFTRRAFANGKIDLAEAEGLADLLSAETEMQRRNAMAMAGGAFSRQLDDWRNELLGLSAQVEAVLDFSDEDDVATLPAEFGERLAALDLVIVDWLARPRAQILRDGFKIVLAGPPNSGKSTLFNELVESEAAITSALAGTTRDVLSRPIAIAGVPFLICDTAGIRDGSEDEIEVIGVARARAMAESADLVLWLGPEGDGPAGAWEIEPQSDRVYHAVKQAPRHRISAFSGDGMDGLRHDLVSHAKLAMPRPGEAALNERQHELLTQARQWIASAAAQADPLLVAEHLRLARRAFDALTGQAATEDMLDTLFGRFCIGK